MRLCVERPAVKCVSALGADGSLLAAIGGHAQAVPLAEVDAAVQDLIGLVLRLSLLQLRAQSGASVPLILNGVHLHAGDSWSAGTAAMLQSFAAAGQQIVVLTESCDVPEQQGRWLDVRAFPQPLAVQQQLPSATELQAPATAAPAVPEPVVVAAELPVTAEPQTEVAESPGAADCGTSRRSASGGECRGAADGSCCSHRGCTAAAAAHRGRRGNSR